MKPFNHVNAKSLEEAAALLSSGKARMIAGGADLLGTLKDNIIPEYPETIVNLKSIAGLEYIKEEDGMLKIGALTRLADIGRDETVKEKCYALHQASSVSGTPNIREQATIGGNIAQLPRCWYFRKTENRFNCARKGGDTCYAIQGQNRYHSIFGGLKTHTSPCTKSCPAGTDISGYMEYIRKGDWDAAARTIMKVNPLPMITSRICPHPCQDGCNQCQYGECVNIHAVERSVGDYILANIDKFYTKPETETGKKVAIIGAGPGGLTAAYFLRKMGHSVTIFERMEQAGGVMRYGVPHYRLPKHYIDDVVNAITGMGVELRTGVTIGKDIEMDEIDKNYDGIYFGTGAWKQPLLGIGGEDLALFGLNFLVDVNKYLEKAIGNDILVCGGGNVAMDVALTAKRLGAKNVTLICLEKREEMPASSEEIARAEAEGVQIFNSWGLGNVITDANGKVSGLDSKRCLSVRDPITQRFSPQYDEDDRRVFESDYIILATGQAVDISFLGDRFLDQLKSARGLIDVDLSTFKTNRPGMYAGGDVATGPNIAIRAVNAGHIAAVGMSRDLGYPVPAEARQTGFRTFDSKGISVHEAAKLTERPAGERTLVDEDEFSLTAEQAAAEAARCMNCSCYAVNPSDTAPVLIALDAKIVTTKRTFAAEDFFAVGTLTNTALDADEIITEIQIPVVEGKSIYKRMALRKTIDFPIVNLAIRIADGKTRICLNSVAPTPYRACKAEEVVNAAGITEDSAAAAGEAAVADACPFEDSGFKIQIAKTMVKRALLEMK